MFTFVKNDCSKSPACLSIDRSKNEFFYSISRVVLNGRKWARIMISMI